MVKIIPIYNLRFYGKIQIKYFTKIRKTVI